MREFFKPWRRKIGLVTLVLACVFAAGWVRSFRTADSLLVMSEQRGALIAISMNGSVSSKRMAQMKGPPGTSWHHDDLSDASQVRFLNEFYDIQPNDMRISYWSIVLPLAAISAWLLLSKPRPAKPVAPSEPSNE